VIDSSESAIIFAGPGGGKTTLLHWVYINLLQHRREVVPFLFTLRLSSEIQPLTDFVALVEEGKARIAKAGNPVIVLVDGYDEISFEQRKSVSEVLIRFKALKIGSFLLTCRTFYDVYDLKVPRFEIEPFGDAEIIGFISAFCISYGVEIDPHSFLAEIRRRGFSEFASHPLMLALICILKTGPLQNVPENSVGLLRR